MTGFFGIVGLVVDGLPIAMIVPLVDHLRDFLIGEI
jgi:hypothetical protein